MGERRSLSLAVRDWLRKPTGDGGLGLDRGVCDVMLDGRPPAVCGDWFYAIHQGARRNQQLAGGMLRSLDLTVTVTARTPQPFDRLGTDLVDRVLDGLDERVDLLVANIFRNQWAIMNLANTYLGAPSTAYVWTEALYPASDGAPEPVRADWFNAVEGWPSKQPAGYQNQASYCGLKSVVQLTGAMRGQRQEDMGP